MALQSLNVLPTAFPNVQAALVGSRQDPIIIRRESTTPNLTVMLERLANGFAGPIPQSRRPVEGSREDGLSIVGEDGRIDPFGMSCQLVEYLPRRVPQPRSAVRATRQDEVAAGREHSARNRFRVSFEHYAFVQLRVGSVELSQRLGGLFQLYRLASETQSERRIGRLKIY